MFEKAGASVGTQTCCARSQAAPGEQSASLEQLPRPEMRQAVSARRRRAVSVARMGQKAKVSAAPAAARTAEAMKSALAVCPAEVHDRRFYRPAGGVALPFDRIQ